MISEGDAAADVDVPDDEAVEDSEGSAAVSDSDALLRLDRRPLSPPPPPERAKAAAVALAAGSVPAGCVGGNGSGARDLKRSRASDPDPDIALDSAGDSRGKKYRDEQREQRKLRKLNPVLPQVPWEAVPAEMERKEEEEEEVEDRSDDNEQEEEQVPLDRGRRPPAGGWLDQQQHQGSEYRYRGSQSKAGLPRRAQRPPSPAGGRGSPAGGVSGQKPMSSKAPDRTAAAGIDRGGPAGAPQASLRTPPSVADPAAAARGKSFAAPRGEAPSAAVLTAALTPSPAAANKRDQRGAGASPDVRTAGGATAEVHGGGPSNPRRDPLHPPPAAPRSATRTPVLASGSGGVMGGSSQRSARGTPPSQRPKAYTAEDSEVVDLTQD